MYAISVFFLGTVFYGLIGPEAVDHVKLPLGVNLAVGDTFGAGQVVLVEGVKLLSESEGIIPALEAAHAMAYVRKLAPTLDRDQIIVLCLSGRGDKDVYTIAKVLGVEL